MSRKEKLITRLQKKPKDFTWDELSTLLKLLGYEEKKKGKTGGSRRRFVHSEAAPISLHKPHPNNILKLYTINDVLETLKNEELI